MKKTLQLEQLSCPTCAKKIEKVANKTKGVNSAKVSFISSKVKVDFDDSVTSLDSVTKNIETLGYKVLKVI